MRPMDEPEAITRATASWISSTYLSVSDFNERNGIITPLTSFFQLTEADAYLRSVAVVNGTAIFAALFH